MDNLYMQLLIVLGIAFIGSLVQSMTGFGYAMLTMPVLSLFLSIEQALVVLAITAMVLMIRVLIGIKFNVCWKIALPMIVIMAIGKYFGTQLLFILDISVLRRILGAVILIISIVLYFFSGKMYIRHSFINSLIVGGLSGTLDGMVGVSGPPLVIYYLSAIKDKNQYLGTMQITLLFASLTTILLHIYYGNVNFSSLRFAAIGLIGVFLGCAVGIRIFKSLDKQSLSKPIYIFLFLVGLYMLIFG